MSYPQGLGLLSQGVALRQLTLPNPVSRLHPLPRITEGDIRGVGGPPTPKQKYRRYHLKVIFQAIYKQLTDSRGKRPTIALQPYPYKPELRQFFIAYRSYHNLCLKLGVPSRS